MFDLAHLRDKIGGFHQPVRRVTAGKHQMAPGTARRLHEPFHFVPLQDARFQGIERLVQHQKVQTFQTLSGPVQRGQGRFPVGGAVFLAPQKALAAGQEVFPQQAGEDGLLSGAARLLHELAETHGKIPAQGPHGLPDAGAGLALAVACIDDDHDSHTPGS